MTQSDFVKVVVGVVIGVAVATVVSMGVFGFGDNKKTEVTLSAHGQTGECEVTKAMLIRGVHKGAKLSWEIENYCPEGERTIVVGNFRTDSAPSTAANCDAAGAAYPFTDGSLNARSRTLRPAETKSNGGIKPSDGKIELKVKDRNELGDNELTYHFDICLGGTKTDPTLLVERY